MGLALQNHNTTRGEYPTGGTEPWHDQGAANPALGLADSRFSKGYGWMVQILPYVENENLRSLSKGYGAGDRARDLEVRKTPVPMYFCPSRRQNIVAQNPRVGGRLLQRMCAQRLRFSDALQSKSSG